MTMLPCHQEVHYEPLTKPLSTTFPNNNKTTIMSKLANRRVVLALIIIGLLGIFTISRSYQSNEFREKNLHTNMWQSFTDSKETVSDMKADSSVLTNKETVPAAATATAPTSCNFIPSSGTSNIEQVHQIAEEDWHMPSDVHLADNDPLWITRRMPFFRQIKGDVHRELGFGGQQLHLTEVPFVRRSLYRHLLQSFHSFAEQHDFHFWLAHGTLLGQYWGQKIMTGDTDVDVQCTLGDLHRVRQYEQQLWEDRFELVVNPHYLVRKTRNIRGLGLDKNVIDARWIDVLTGYYIDITALSAVQADQPLLDVGPFTSTEQDSRKAKVVQDKSPHHYSVDLINPTKRCQFENMNLWCPNKIHEILQEEYHQYNLPQFHTWRFNQTIQAFNEITCPQLLNMYQYPNAQNCDQECKQVVQYERSFHWSSLVMTGDVRKVGCLLKVTYKPDKLGKEVSREYWAREDPENKIVLRNTPNVTYPGIVL